MRKPEYFVEPTLVKRWFREPVVMYALCENGEYWCGDGGGDWIPYTRTIHKYPSFSEAKTVLDKLTNPHHNTTHEKQSVVIG